MKGAISFCDEAITYVEGSGTEKSGVSIKRFYKKDLPKNWIVNGVMTDKEQVLTALQEMIAENKLEKNQIGIVIDSNKVLFKEIAVPKAKPKELRELVKQEIENSLNDMGDFLIDFVEKGEEDGLIQVIAFALSTKIIAEYITLTEEAGIQAASLDLATNCISKIVSCVDGADIICVMSINRDNVNISLMEEGNTVFSWNVRLNFTTFLASDNLEIAVEELADNYNRIFQFQRSRNKSSEIKKAYLTGSFPAMNQVQEILQNFITVPCEVFSGGTTIKVDASFGDNKKLSAEELGSFVPQSALFDVNQYLSAVGALIRRG